jgi:tetratricopeptide (TPR) repeat protein
MKRLLSSGRSASKLSSPALIETMGLCALTEPRPPATLTAERRDVIGLAGKAAWALVLQQPEQAEAGYKQLLEQYPNEPGVHYAFEKEIQIDPANWPALIVAARLQMRQGSSEKALQMLRDAQKLAPARYRWLCHAEIGRAYMNAGNLDAAIPELRTAGWLNPEPAQIHFLLGAVLPAGGRAEDAQRETAEFQKWKALQDPLGVPGLRTFGNAARRN